MQTHAGSSAFFCMEESIRPMDLEDDSHRDRRRVILELLRNHRVANQLELVGLLAERGLEATQSSVSRDLASLGIAKVAGRYVAPAPAGEGRSDLSAIVRFVLGARTAGPNLAVISTPAGERRLSGSRSTARAGPRSSAPWPATTRCSSRPRTRAISSGSSSTWTSRGRATSGDR